MTASLSHADLNPPPGEALPSLTEFVRYPTEALLEASRSSLEVYVALLKRRRGGEVKLDIRIQQQRHILLDALRPTMSEVSRISQAARHRRWARLCVGGGVMLGLPWISDTIGRWLANWFARISGADPEPLATANLELLRLRCQYGVAVPLAVFSVLFAIQTELVIKLSTTIGGRLLRLYTEVENRNPELEDSPSAREALYGWQWSWLLFWL